MATILHEDPAVILENATLDYGYHRVVDQVDFKIHPGETKIILGPSGVGKSTILRGILGLLSPTEGKITVFGQNISNMAEPELVRIRLRMAMVFQNGALFDSMSIQDNVSFRLREFSLLPQDEIEKRTQEVLKFVGLQGAADLRPAQLSGGMRKRVAIARALAPNPELILFDEPTVGLDPVNLCNVEKLILKLKRNSNVAIIIVTHDIGSAFRLADKITMLHDGKFIFEDTPENVKKNPDPRVQAFLNPEAFEATLR